MPETRNVAARVLAWVEELASKPRGAVALFAVALLVYALRAVAWPLKTGRDLDEYLLAYIQLFDQDVLLPWSMLFRTPVTPIFAGGALDPFDGRLAEPGVAILYAGSVVAWAAAARTFGPRAALAVAVALLAYQGWAAMFHELSSETAFAAAFSLFALLVTRAAVRPSVGRFAGVGATVALLALIRPGNAILLGFAVFPLALPGGWRERIRWTAAVALTAALPLVAWSVHNGVRFDSWSLARGGNAIIPFYRAFITDNIVEPGNGESSRRLAAAMQDELLTREPYRSYRVTLDELFARGSFRVHEDLYLLSDQVFGWDSDYRILREAGIEGVRAHPETYGRGVLGTIWDELARAYFRDLPATTESQPTTEESSGLPTPTEDQPIPGGQVVWISRPDQRIRQVWTSPTRWHFEFERPSDRRRFRQIQSELAALFDALPDRTGSAELALRLNQLSRWYPRPWMWLLLGIVALFARRPRGSAPLLALALAAVGVVTLNALGLFADLHFVLPVAPAFVLFGLGLLFAPTARQRPR